MPRHCLFLLTLTLLIFASCDKDNTPVELRFLGNAQCSIEYWEFDPGLNQDVYIETKNYSYQAEVFRKAPLVVGKVTESNPFSLSVYPVRGSGQAEEGHIDISSAMVYQANAQSQILLQYWTFTEVNGVLTGTLTDNHTAEASAMNIVWAWDDIAGTIMDMPFVMANGCAMSGTIDANNISLTVSGESKDTQRKFTYTVNAVLQ